MRTAKALKAINGFILYNHIVYHDEESSLFYVTPASDMDRLKQLLSDVGGYVLWHARHKVGWESIEDAIDHVKYLRDNPILE